MNPPPHDPVRRRKPACAPPVAANSIRKRRRTSSPFMAPLRSSTGRPPEPRNGSGVADGTYRRHDRPRPRDDPQSPRTLSPAHAAPRQTDAPTHRESLPTPDAHRNRSPPGRGSPPCGSSRAPKLDARGTYDHAETWACAGARAHLLRWAGLRFGRISLDVLPDLGSLCQRSLRGESAGLNELTRVRPGPAAGRRDLREQWRSVASDRGGTERWVRPRPGSALRGFQAMRYRTDATGPR